MIEKSATATQSALHRTYVPPDRPETLAARIERLNEAISRRAFELFEQDKRMDGKDVQHWLQAEKEILHPVRINLEETEKQFLVQADVPGFHASELEVNVEPQRITISGQHEPREETKEGRNLEAPYGVVEILRILELPCEVMATKVTATLKNGLLEIQIPKAASSVKSADLNAPAV